MRKFIPKVTQVNKKLEDRIKFGISLMRERLLDKALLEFEAVLQDAPELSMVHLMVGQIYFQRRQYQPALTAFEAAMQQDALLPQPVLSAGLTQMKLGNLEAAHQHFQTAIALDPKLEWAYAGAVAVLIKRNQYAEAVELCRRALAQNPKVMVHRLQLAEALRQQGYLEDAIAELNQALQLNPRSAPAYALLGKIYLAQGQTQAAQTAFRASLDASPLALNLSPGLQFDFAQTLLSENQLDGAVDLLGETPDFDQLAQRQHQLQGDLHLQQGNVKQAAEEYRMALQLRSFKTGETIELMPPELPTDLDETQHWQAIAQFYRTQLEFVPHPSEPPQLPVPD